MFKIEVTVGGEDFNYLSANKLEDDFLKVWPDYLSKEHGVEIQAEDLRVSKFTAEEIRAVELMDSEGMEMAVASGKVVITRKHKAKFKAGDKIDKSDYVKDRKKLEKKFRKSKTKPGMGLVSSEGKGQHKGKIILEAEDALVKDVESLELEVTPTPLKKWPYAANGKFLGND